MPEPSRETTRPPGGRHWRSAAWQFLRDFVRGVLSEPARVIGLMRSAASIEVVEDHENRLELNANNRRVVADRATRAVRLGGRVVAHFGAIDAIEIRYHENGDGPEWWAVSLRVGSGRRVAIGRTTDDAEASIAAARLGTITGKRVVAVN